MKTKFSSTILFFTGLLFVSFNSFCQTYISANIFANTHWTVSGSPYIINNNIIVFEDATLAIDPGVTVKFNDHLGIEIRGKLYAVGTELDSISFTSNSASPTIGIWRGIIFSGTTEPLGIGDQGTLEYFNGMYADTLLNMDVAYHGPYRYKHCFFYQNKQVNYDGGMPRTYFTNCTFYENIIGLTQTQFLHIDNNDWGGFASKCIFINNIEAFRGFENLDSSYFSGNTGVALVPGVGANYCVVENNNIGVKALFNSVTNLFTNNYVIDNSIGVWAQSFFNGSISFSKNQICNNSEYNFKYTGANSANISNNCWCTNDSVSIRNGIYDGYTPESTSGLVTFLPVAAVCNKPDLFIPPICTSDNNVIIKCVIPGGTYQWQENSGAGFTDLSDNNSYSGTNSRLLQLNGSATAYVGYLYRCIVNGNIHTPDNRIAFINTWTGSIDSSWENPNNWSCGLVPDSNTDVIIANGTAELSSNGLCRSIKVYSPGRYIINPGFNLTVYH